MSIINQGTYLKFQDKKDYNFSNKSQTNVAPNSGNIYSVLVLNKVIATQKFNKMNVANNEYFLAKSINMQKSCEVNPERLPMFATRKNVKNTSRPNYKKIGYNKHTLYSMFKLMRRDKLFLNEKFYQNLLGKRAFSFFNSGLKHYSRAVREIKKYNDFIENQIWNVADRRNQYFLNVFDISAYTYHSYVDVTKEKNENRYVKGARLFLDIWDSIDDYSSYWYADYWFDATYPNNLPEENKKRIAESMKTLREYETFYGMFKCREKMKKHLWRLRVGKTMYLNTFSKNATRINFLNGIDPTECVTNNWRIRAKSNSLLRFLYTKYLFPRNRAEAWNNYAKFNVFAPDLEVSEINFESAIDTKGKVHDGFEFNCFKQMGKRTNIEGSNLLQKVVALKSPYKKKIGIKNKIKVSNLKIIANTNKRVSAAGFLNKSKIKLKIRVVFKKKLKIENFVKLNQNLVKKFRKYKSKFLKNKSNPKVLLNTRLHLNRLRLKSLVITSLFSTLRLNELVDLKKQKERLNYFEEGFEEFKHFAEKVWINNKVELKTPFSLLEKIDVNFPIEGVDNLPLTARGLQHYTVGDSVKLFKFNKIAFKKYNAVEDDLEASVNGDVGIVKLSRWKRKSKSEPSELKSKRKRKRAFRGKSWIEALHCIRVYSSMTRVKILANVFSKKTKANKNYTIKSLADIKKVYKKYGEVSNFSSNYADYFETIAKNKLKYEQALGSYVFAKKVKKTRRYREVFAKQETFFDSKPLRPVFIMNMAVKSKVKLTRHFSRITNLRNSIMGDILLAGASLTNMDKFNSYSNKFGLNMLNPHKETSGKKIIVRTGFKNKQYCDIVTFNFIKFKVKPTKISISKLLKFKIAGVSTFSKARDSAAKVLAKRKRELVGYTFSKTKRLFWFQDKPSFSDFLERNNKRRESLFALVNDYLGIITINNYLNIGRATLNQAGTAIRSPEFLKFEDRLKKNYEILSTTKYFPFYKDYLANYIDTWKTAAFVFTTDITANRPLNSTMAMVKLWGNDLNRLGIINSKVEETENEERGFMSNHPKHFGRLEFLFQPNVQNLEIELPEDVDSEMVRLQAKATELNALDDSEIPTSNYRPAPIFDFARLRLWGHTTHKAKAKRLATFTQNNLSRIFSTWDDDNYPLSNFYLNIEETMTAHAIEENKNINMRKRPVFGKAAMAKQAGEGWMHVIHKHQFLRDVHTQVGSRKYPEIWYKPGRKKYPLKLHKKDWALKIPLTSRTSHIKGASSTVSTYDSSIVYYRNMGWTSWTRYFKRMPVMFNFYRYGRDGDPIKDLPLDVLHTGGGEQIRENAIYEEYLSEFSLLGHNWFDFVPAVSDDHIDGANFGTAITKFEYQTGKDTLISMRRHYRSYRDSMKNWFKRLKPMFTYSGIKTYNRYNSYLMQKNSEMRTGRYKTLFSNYAFANRLDRPRFAANLVEISFFRLAEKAFELSNYDIQLTDVYNINRRELYLQYLSLKTTKYKNRKTFIDSNVFLSNVENSVETLRKTDRDYLADELYDSKVGEFEDQNKSSFVMTRDQFKFVNRTYRSTLNTHGRFKTLDMQYGLKTFVAKSPYWW